LQGSPAMKITALELSLCPLRLEKPIVLGTVAMTTRDYVLLRISTDEGITGVGIAYRSKTSLVEAAAAIAPMILGRDPLMRREILKSCEDSAVQGRATIARALSLIDIALWDIAAKQARLPLYQMIGGLRSAVPAVPVAGFSYESRAPEDVEAELEQLLDSGHKLIKIMIKGHQASDNAAYVARMAKLVCGRAQLVLDAHWSWRHLTEALDTCSRIDDLGLAFIEDPFLPQQWRLTGELRTKLRTPIAVGEDTLDQNGFVDLVQNVDVLRIDATASGGITGAIAAIDLASSFGRQCLPHSFPYLHLQLACVFQAVLGVEYIPALSGADPIRSILNSYPRLEHGSFVVDDAPGNGLDIDWHAVGRVRDLRQVLVA
jgi:L-alanine-DL-glutamate epimerase-like enolase superfamily enzyme